MSLALVPLSAPATDSVRLSASLAQLWDGNFERVRDGASEQRTALSAGLRVRPRLGPHDLLLSGELTRYRHQRQRARDATTADYTARWTGPLLMPALSARVEVRQRERPAERLEFTGGDIVARRRQRLTLRYGEEPGWETELRATALQTRYDRRARQGLNRDQEATSLALAYVSDRESRIGLRLSRGRSRFPDNPASRRRALRFDFSRADIELDWRLTSRSRLRGRMGYFSRSGRVNDGNGANARLRYAWQATSELDVSALLALRQPSAGENPNDIAEERRYQLGAEWSANARWSLATEIARERREFADPSGTTGRIERIDEWMPLAIEYSAPVAVNVRLAARVQRRESPVRERTFTARIVTARITGRF